MLFHMVLEIYHVKRVFIILLRNPCRVVTPLGGGGAPSSPLISTTLATPVNGCSHQSQRVHG